MSPSTCSVVILRVTRSPSAALNLAYQMSSSSSTGAVLVEDEGEGESDGESGTLGSRPGTRRFGGAAGALVAGPSAGWRKLNLVLARPRRSRSRISSAHDW